MKLLETTKEKENESGSMDFFNRIFKLIRGNTEPNNLKRRSDDNTDCSQLTKYRKVTNEFPKVIDHPFEDDIQILRAPPPNVIAPLISQNKRKVNDKTSDKTNRKVPATVFPMRRSNNFADLEYSDDEDDVLENQCPTQIKQAQEARRLLGSYNNIDHGGNKSGLNARGPNVVDISKVNLDPNEVNPLYAKPKQRIRNIPIQLEGPSLIDMQNAATRPQVPPLIDPKTGNMITSSYSSNSVPELKPIRKSLLSNIFNSYGNSINSARGKKIPTENNINNNLQSLPVINSSRQSSFNLMNGGSLLDMKKLPTFRKQNAKNIAHSSYMLNPPNTVINQVYNYHEKESYEELLKKLAPSVYNTTKTSGLGTSSAYMQNGFNSPIHTNFGIFNKNKIAKAGVHGRKSIHGSNQFIVDHIDLIDKKSSKKDKFKSVDDTIINLDEDEEVHDKNIIDLDAEENTILTQCRKVKGSDTDESSDDSQKKLPIDKNKLPYVEPVNSLKEKYEWKPVLQPSWLTQFKEKFQQKEKLREKQISEAAEEARKRSEETARIHDTIIEKLTNFRIPVETVIIDEEEEEEVEFPEFSDDDDNLIKKAVYRGSPDEVLIQKFNMNIRRRDIQTLVGDSWLNDEVINFYMNLLMERGEIRASEGYPKVYAMNTFFTQRLMSNGHAAVRRWTRKVDLFVYDVIPVPVHVGGVHWCMAIIHLKNKTIKYYDSMGTANPRVLQALEQYLKDESQDKKGVPFDTSGFVKESVPDCPRQMNGSDCGVFSCMFAEYVTRNKPITFSQQHMQYFRHKMVLEIVKGKLLL